MLITCLKTAVTRLTNIGAAFWELFQTQSKDICEQLNQIRMVIIKHNQGNIKFYNRREKRYHETFQRIRTYQLKCQQPLPRWYWYHLWSKQRELRKNNSRSSSLSLSSKIKEVIGGRSQFDSTCWCHWGGYWCRFSWRCFFCKGESGQWDNHTNNHSNIRIIDCDITSFGTL